MLILGIISYFLLGIGIIALIITQSKVNIISISKEIEILAALLVFDLLFITQGFLGWWIAILMNYFMKSIFDEKIQPPFLHYKIYSRILFFWGMIGVEFLMMFGNFAHTTQFQSGLFLENAKIVLMLFGAILILLQVGGIIYIVLNIRFSKKSALDLMRRWALCLGLFLMSGLLSYGIIRLIEQIGAYPIVLALIVYGVQASFMVLSTILAWKTPRQANRESMTAHSHEPRFHAEMNQMTPDSDAQLEDDEATELAPEAKYRYRGFSISNKTSAPPIFESFSIPNKCPKCQNGLDNNGFCLKCEMVICPRCYNLNKKGTINCTCGYYLGKR